MNLKNSILATVSGTFVTAPTDLDSASKSALVSFVVTILTQLFNTLLEERKERRRQRKQLKELANK